MISVLMQILDSLVAINGNSMLYFVLYLGFIVWQRAAGMVEDLGQGFQTWESQVNFTVNHMNTQR